MSLHIPDHPLPDADFIVPDTAALDQLAVGATDPYRLLFLDAPRALLRSSSARYTMYLSGYFGGLWLRGVLVGAQPDGYLAQSGQPPGPAEVSAVVAQARAALAQTAEDAMPALAVSYGYNRGYILQILKTQGRRGEVPTWPGPAEHREGARDAEASGRQVWSGQISVEGVGDEDFDLLLELSHGFLDAIGSIASTFDPDANANLSIWTNSYLLGLFDNRPGRQLPVLE